MNEPFYGSDKDLDARARRIDLAHEPDFDLGSVQIRPSLRTIVGPQGESMLEPKVMQVLVALGSPVGAILSRDDLIERCWEGRVVGDTSINRVISILRSGFKAAAGDEVQVENVPKVGYRLLVTPARSPQSTRASASAAGGGKTNAQPQSALALDDPSGPETRRTQPPSQHETRTPLLSFARRPWLWASSGFLAVAVLLAAFFWIQQSGDSAVRPVRVAMLPLTVADEVDPLFAKGLESELRAQLARVGQMEVTNSDTARMLFEEGLSAQEICDRLGADFAWVGSLGVDADRVNISARIINAETKETTFREELSAAPDAAQYLPLRLARAISNALGRPADGRGPQSTVDAGDYSLYLTALGLIKSRGNDQRIAARSILEQVTQGSPEFADGWAGLAKAYYLSPSDSRESMSAYREKALETARFALTLDPDAIDALKVIGMMGEAAKVRLEALNRAVELDPGDSEAWFWLGITRREFLLSGEDPLEGALRMVQIDPLWPASWRTSDLAAEFGELEQAIAIENTILSAAITPSQRLLAEARIARIRGDLSRFNELSAEATPSLSPAERTYGSSAQNRMVAILLNLPVADADISAREAPFTLVAKVVRGELPSLAEMNREGVNAPRFWRSPTLLMPSLPLFIKEGREAELLSLYDEMFADHAGFVAFTKEQQYAEQIIPEISPYIALMLRRAGRENEAIAHLEEAERQLAKWKSTDTNWVKPVIWELQIAAITGDNSRAIAAVERLPDYGWPYTIGHVDPLTVGLIKGNPIYKDLRALPEVQAVLAPIEQVLARERTEVLSRAG